MAWKRSLKVGRPSRSGLTAIDRAQDFQQKPWGPLISGEKSGGSEMCPSLVAGNSHTS